MPAEPPWWGQPSGRGILVGGGAPNLHLAAGALCAFYRREQSFDVIGASGAGALPALLYAAPKSGDRVASLRATVDMNIDDTLYNVIPFNFKIFFKRGPFAEPFWRLGRLLPRFRTRAQDRYRPSWRRLYNDWVDLMVAAVTPTTLWYGSPSVCTRVGVVDDLVDWTALPQYPKEIFVNAFDLDDQKLELFDKTQLTPAAFYAALALPWLYEPTAVKDRMGKERKYTEGAAHDPSGLEALWAHAKDTVDMLIALDTVGPDLWIDPGNVQEALELALMDPIVCLDEYVLALYGLLEFELNSHGQRAPKLYSIPFPVPPWDRARILDWSYSNAVNLWDIGHAAADRFCDALPDPAKLEAYRYYPRHKDRPQVREFLRLFDGLLAI